MATQIRLSKRPGPGSGPEWEITNDETPALDEGQVRLGPSYISIDPGMMGWISAKKSYMPPINEGDVMRAFGVGEVLESRSETFPVGSFATGFTGVQSEAVLGPEAFLRPVDPDVAPLNHYMSGLGMPGFTGYFGMSDLSRPREGETVVVSACAGAVGSIASQTAKIAGARVIGIAGGPAKCALLTEEFGLDGAIDYKAGPIKDSLKELCPKGVDVYFDNVGGDTLDSLLMRMNRHGRVVLCGGISQYGDMDVVKGPSNYLQIVAQSLSVRGFTMLDYMHRIPEGIDTLATWVNNGKIIFKEDILQGIETFPEAFEMIFAGKNFGKLMLRVKE